MGLLATTVSSAMALALPERKMSVGAAIPTWQDGVPQYSQESSPYLRLAREGYGANEIIYTAIEELCTSAAEPHIAAYKGQGKHREQLDSHPIVDLLNHPNPWLDRYGLIASMILYLSIGGNAYLHKERSAAGRVVELWPLRPDRVWVIPDARTHIGGYKYDLGDQHFTLPAGDVSHARYRNPWDDFYGLAPLAVAARRTDTDVFMREFTRSFFVNAGVPSGLLNIQRVVEAPERELIRSQFRSEYGGVRGWHGTLVLDGGEASYVPMALPLGERGLVMPELDEISEVRLAMCFGVPLELIGARISMLHGNRSTTREARAGFWDETLVPLYKMLASRLSQDLVPEFGGCDEIDFDLSTVQALQEDADALMKRATGGYLAGVLKRAEARKLVGQEADAGGADDVYWVARGGGLLPEGETLVPGAPGAAPFGDPAALDAVPVTGADGAPVPAPRQNGVTNGVAR